MKANRKSLLKTQAQLKGEHDDACNSPVPSPKGREKKIEAGNMTDCYMWSSEGTSKRVLNKVCDLGKKGGKRKKKEKKKKEMGK